MVSYTFLIQDEVHLWLQLSGLVTLWIATFCQLFIISLEFKEHINEILKFEELFNKFAHNLEIYNVKITVYFMYNIYIFEMHY